LRLSDLVATAISNACVFGAHLAAAATGLIVTEANKEPDSAYDQYYQPEKEEPSDPLFLLF
jgi:hypothetical protein